MRVGSVLPFLRHSPRTSQRRDHASLAVQNAFFPDVQSLSVVPIVHAATVTPRASSIRVTCAGSARPNSEGTLTPLTPRASAQRRSI